MSQTVAAGVSSAQPPNSAIAAQTHVRGKTGADDDPKQTKATHTGESSEASGKQDAVQISPNAQARAYTNRAIIEAFKNVGLPVGAIPQDLRDEMEGLLAEHPKLANASADGQSPIDKIAGEFTPEKTADRIYGFAVSWYEKWRTDQKLEDSEESRKQFSEYIGKAVDKGIGEARQILGKVPDSIKAGIDETQSLVHSKLDDFVENGLATSADDLAAARDYGLSFNASFAGAAQNRKAFMTNMLDRVDQDGTLRLDSANSDEQTGSSLKVTG